MENDSKAFSQVTEDFVILLNHYPEDCNYFSKTAVQSNFLLIYSLNHVIITLCLNL